MSSYPASAKQIAFATTLINERLPEVGRAPMLAKIPTMDGRTISATISALLQRPREAAGGASTTTAPRPDVAAGHYALVEDGVTKFYKVDRPEAPSRWAGYTFVKVQASDDYWPVKGAAATAVLEAIAADPKAALTRYGLELGVCGRCNRTLTDETSRAYGIGPDCRAKLGY